MSSETYIPDDTSIPTDPVALAMVIRNNRGEPGALDLIREELRIHHGVEGSWSIWDAAKYLVDALDDLDGMLTTMLSRCQQAEGALSRLADRHPAYRSTESDDMAEHLHAIGRQLRAVSALHRILGGAS